jgi:hypothetical protein
MSRFWSRAISVNEYSTQWRVETDPILAKGWLDKSDVIHSRSTPSSRDRISKNKERISSGEFGSARTLSTCGRFWNRF